MRLCREAPDDAHRVILLPDCYLQGLSCLLAQYLPVMKRLTNYPAVPKMNRTKHFEREQKLTGKEKKSEKEEKADSFF